MTTLPQIGAAKGVSTDSMYAWKGADVFATIRHSRIIRFKPMVSTNPTYGIRDVAECGMSSKHESPYRNCGCGFNAWHDIDVARTYMDIRLKRDCWCYERQVRWVSCQALLRVRVEGDVIEGTLDAENLDKWGYRAARQIVTDIFFADECKFCCKKAVGLSVKGSTTTLRNVSGGVLFQPVRPTCGACSSEILQPSELMSVNDVHIQLGYPSE